MELNEIGGELDIVDLIQFPYSGRKTGKLVVGTDNDQAELFYQQGSLVHASLGESSGMEALVQVLDWNEVGFEFVPDVEAVAKTIQLDLHQAVTQALKLHDERRVEQDSQRTAGAQSRNEALSNQLTLFVQDNEFVVHACVMSEDGCIVASAHGPEEPRQGTEPLVHVMHSLIRSYPRGSLNRAIVEDAMGTVVLVRLKNGGLIALAKKEAPLGAVSMSVTRFAMEMD